MVITQRHVNKRHMVDSRSDRMFFSVNTVFLVVILILTVYPLIYVLSSSLSSARDVALGHVCLLPVNPSLEGSATRIFMWRSQKQINILT